jgi:hypothetical protein
MFAPQHFAIQHFAPQHFPPIVDIETPSGGSGGSGLGQNQSFFVPIARKRDVITTRLREAEKVLSAKAKRRLDLEAFDIDLLNIQALERAVAEALAELPQGRRVVDPPITVEDITLPAPLFDPALDDDLNLRLLLLLGC